MNTEILFVIDRSGSMSSLDASACAGFNNFIEEQRTVPGQARVSLTFFNDTVKHEYTAVPIQQIDRLRSIAPRSMTAMYDGIGDAMNLHSARIEGEQWADSTIMVIITDGHENSSRKYSGSKISSMIRLAKSIGWQFIFLGANIDVQKVAGTMGIDAEFTYEFESNAASMSQGYATVSATARAMRSWGL